MTNGQVACRGGPARRLHLSKTPYELLSALNHANIIRTICKESKCHHLLSLQCREVRKTIPSKTIPSQTISLRNYTRPKLKENGDSRCDKSRFSYSKVFDIRLGIGSVTTGGGARSREENTTRVNISLGSQRGM